MSQQQEILDQLGIIEDTIIDADADLKRSREKQLKRQILTKEYKRALDVLVSTQSQLKAALKDSVSKLNSEYLKSCIDYTPDSGRVVWRHRPGWHFNSSPACEHWNRRNNGALLADGAKELGKKSMGDHSLYVLLDNRPHKIANLCWMLVYGVFPGRVVHMNKDKTDFRIVNLNDLAPINKT